MKRRLVHTAAVALAVAGLSMAPAAAAPPIAELPVTPGPSPALTAPGDAEIAPNASFCQVVSWWIWCRI